MRPTPSTYATAYLGAVHDSTPAELKVITARFWALVWKRRHWSWRSKIVAQVEHLWQEQQGLKSVELSVAKPLSAAAEAKLKRELEEALGCKVELKVTLKPHLLAGLVVTVGDKRYDASLKGRIDNLYHALAGTKQ